MNPDMDSRSCQPFEKDFRERNSHSTARGSRGRPTRSRIRRSGRLKPRIVDARRSARVSRPPSTPTASRGRAIRPTRKGRWNRQKTVLPPPVCFGTMSVNRKSSVRLPVAGAPNRGGSDGFCRGRRTLAPPPQPRNDRAVNRPGQPPQFQYRRSSLTERRTHHEAAGCY